MRIILVIPVIFFLSCNTEKQKENGIDYYPTYTKELEDTIRTIDLTYIAWACQCAEWTTMADISRYQDTGKLSEHTIFIEAADSTLELADTLGYSGDFIRFTGQFYKDKGYPKNYPKTEMQVDKAKVFRYTKYEILESGYKNFIDTTGSNK